MRIFALPEGLINDLLSGILQQLLEGGGGKQPTTNNVQQRRDKSIKRSDGRAVRQRSAKPCTAVRFRFRPHENRVAIICNAVLCLYCTANITFAMQSTNAPA